MSDVQYGPGWWQASDGKWYRPEQRPGLAELPPSTGKPGRRNAMIVAATIAVGLLVIAATFVLTRGDSTNTSDQGGKAVTTAPAAMPSAPQAVRDTTAYSAMLALGIVDTFRSSTTLAGQNVDVVIDLTEVYQPGQSFGVNVYDSSEGNVLFNVPTNASGVVQATFTLLDPETSSPSGQLTVFFTSQRIDRVFLTGSGAPVELVRT
jgi:hypothetical protein